MSKEHIKKSEMGRMLLSYGWRLEDGEAEDRLRNMKPDQEVACLLAFIATKLQSEDFQLAARYMARREHRWIRRQNARHRESFERTKAALEAKHGPCPLLVEKAVAREIFGRHRLWVRHAWATATEVDPTVFRCWWMGRKTKTRQAAQAWLKKRIKHEQQAAQAGEVPSE